LARRSSEYGTATVRQAMIILKMHESLLVTTQVEMHDRVDSFTGRMLDNIAAMSRILDAEPSLLACNLHWRSPQWNLDYHSGACTWLSTLSKEWPACAQP
jgi:hypothetical protein